MGCGHLLQKPVEYRASGDQSAESSDSLSSNPNQGTDFNSATDTYATPPGVSGSDLEEKELGSYEDE